MSALALVDHYLTAPRAAAYLGFPTVKAFHQWRYRERARGHARGLDGLRRGRGGRTLLFDRADLDAACPRAAMLEHERAQREQAEQRRERQSHRDALRDQIRSHEDKVACA